MRLEVLFSRRTADVTGNRARGLNCAADEKQHTTVKQSFFVVG